MCGWSRACVGNCILLFHMAVITYLYPNFNVGIVCIFVVVGCFLSNCWTFHSSYSSIWDWLNPFSTFECKNKRGGSTWLQMVYKTTSLHIMPICKLVWWPHKSSSASSLKWPNVLSGNDWQESDNFKSLCETGNREDDCCNFMLNFHIQRKLAKATWYYLALSQMHIF